MSGPRTSDRRLASRTTATRRRWRPGGPAAPAGTRQSADPRRGPVDGAAAPAGHGARAPTGRPATPGGSAVLVVVARRGGGGGRRLPVGQTRGQPVGAAGGPGHRHRPGRGRAPASSPASCCRQGRHRQLARLPDLEPVPQPRPASTPAPTPSTRTTLRRRRRGAGGRAQRVLAGGPAGLHRVGAGRAGRPAPRHDADRLRAAGHQRHASTRRGSRPGSTSLEGLLGTGTYQLVPGETDTQLLTDMIDRFDQQADAMDLTAGAAALGLTPYQVITVASIVEKEGVIQKNLGPVARVIFNRLAAGHAAPDGLDRPLRRGTGRGHGDQPGPGHPSPVQHVPEHRAHPHADLLPVPAGPPAALRPAGRVVAVLRGRRSPTAPRRSPTPSPSSRPTRPLAAQRGCPEPTDPRETGQPVERHPVTRPGRAGSRRPPPPWSG